MKFCKKMVLVWDPLGASLLHLLTQATEGTLGRSKWQLFVASGF